MCKPARFMKDDRSAASYASSELSSGVSCLYAPPEPIQPDDAAYREDAYYMADSDHMVRHAVDHLRAAQLAVSAERHFMEVVEVELRMSRATGEAFTLATFNKLRRQIYALYAEKSENERRMQHAATPDR